MNIEDKDLAIKVFDHFFKKADIISIEICFYNNYDLCVNVRIAKFYDSYLLTNFLTCNDNDVCKLKIFNKNRFLLPEIPKELKINLIEHCISNEVSLFIPFSYIEAITIIPKVSSLEELAIKMELES